MRRVLLARGCDRLVKVLFDTNVILDIWKKDDFFLNSFAAYDVCMLRRWDTCIAATCVPDLEYLLVARGILSRRQVREAMSNLFEMFDVVDVSKCDCLLAHASDMPDLEDGIIAFAAQRNKVDAIVTRNERDYELSPVPALTPKGFVRAYKPAGVDYAEEMLG